jgi:DNA-binding PadR family transcriptional regulator
MNDKFNKLFNDVLDDCLKEGYIVESEGGYQITDKGIAEYEKRKENYERLAKKQKQQQLD